ncbi:hypothetical protein B296_00046288 [Ensete ventricosum]|uniref:Uncharacterized protein n=1 Tax=Ensete ventricosum TaxID=4639 RepID=A0A426XAC5_ENSVE|nr:hypothetical protein B296_00046288 [Ensete ventricosum]
MRALHSRRLGLFLCGFLLMFEVFFRWFTIFILHLFNHEEPTLFAEMFLASWGSDGSRRGCRPRHGWFGSNSYPSYLVVQSLFLDTRERNCRHKSIRLSCLYFSSNL